MRTRVGMPAIPRRPNPRRVQPRPRRRGLTGWDRPPYWFATYLCRGLGHRPDHRTPRDQFRTCTRCHNPTEWMTPR